MARIIQFQYMSEELIIVLDDEGTLWEFDGNSWCPFELPSGLSPDEEDGDAQR